MDYLGLVVESARQSLVNPVRNTRWSPKNGLNDGLVRDQVGESVWNPRPNVYRYDLQDHYNAGNCLKKQSSPRDVQFAKDTSGNYLLFHVEEKGGRIQYCPVRKGSSANGYCIDGLDNAMFAVTTGHRDWRNMSVRDIRIARGALTVTMENSMGKDSYAIIRINDDGVKLVEDVVNGKHGLVIDRLSDLIGSKYMIPIESADDVGNPRRIDVVEGRRPDTFGHIDDNDVFHFDYKKWCLRIARQIVGTVREMVDAQLKTADKDSTGVVELLPGLAIEITEGTLEDVSVALNNPSNCRNWIVKPLADELRSHDALAHSGRQKRGHIGYEFAKDFISGTFDPSGCLFKIHISKGFEDPDRPVYERDESDDGNSANGSKDWSFLEDDGYYWRDDGVAPNEGIIAIVKKWINMYFHPLKYCIIPHVDRIEIIVRSVRKRWTWPVPMPSYQRCVKGLEAIFAECHTLGWECVGPYPSEFGNPPGGEDYILRHLKDKYGAMESAFSRDDGEGPSIRFTLKSQDPKKVYGRDATAEELQNAEPADDLRNEMDEFGSI